MITEHITNLTLQQLQQTLQEMGEPGFRFKQIVHWLYKKRVDSLDAMRNVAKSTRQKLQEKYTVEKLPLCYLLESKNNDAVKFGFQVGTEGDIIESVLLYDGKRRSLCVSSQLGCALGCVFCETGNMGYIRNLTQHEILGQLIAANDYLAGHSDKLVSNIIFMGMGETLLNYDTFLPALEIIMDERCFSIGGRKITVSTAGIVPAIEKLIQEKLNIKLAISLNAYSNDQRNAIMPINKQYPIEDLIKVAKSYYKKLSRRITFEYVLIQGENDTEEAVVALTGLLKKVPCKINLIPLNPYTNSSLKASEEEQLNKFAKQLAENGLYVTVRKSRGQDISGACGQLAGKSKHC